MGLKTEYHSSPIITIITSVLILILVGGCSSAVEITPAPDSLFDPLGTAQAQASEFELATPQTRTPKATPVNFEPWIRANSHLIQSLDSDDFSDLRFLEPLLDGKRIVQLGEDDHFTAEQSILKIRLIKYLHQELGYEVIAFESGLLDCYLTNMQISQLSADQAMKRSIHGIWHTEEVLPLFDYLKENSASTTPLLLTGFDSQPSQTNQDDQTRFFYDLLKGLKADYAVEIRALEESILTVESVEELTRIASGDPDPVLVYEDLARFLALNQDKLQQINSNSPVLVRVAEQAAWSRARFIEGRQVYDPFNSGEGFKVRDQAMAANVEFLAEVLFPDQKIVLWSHNNHISEITKFAGYNNMGSHLSDYFGEELYSIAVIGYRPPTILVALDDLLHLYGEPYLFIDLSTRDQEVDSSFKPILDEHDLPLHEYYDAIIYIDKISDAHFLEEN